jgi:hypothetical protein
MKSFAFYTFLLGLVAVTSAQQFTLETPLDAGVNETSGLLYLNNTLITHNDSANTNQLFDIDILTGNILRTVTLTNVTNIDWEDLTHDDTHIYIGDFGNNQGNRVDLKVYRIAIADYFANTTLTADLINFSYNEQTDFTSSPFATNYDAEGLIHYNNSLYIFSKNWIDGFTNIYELSKTPGTYSLSPIDTVNVEGLISGASYNLLSDTILLSGYDADGAFLVQLNGFSAGLFSNGNVIKTSLAVPENYSPQIEGIIAVNANEYFISAEENAPDASGLYSFNLSTLSTEVIDTLSLDLDFYPNPAHQSITISQSNCTTNIYTNTGRLIKTSIKKQINVSDLSSGLYVIKIEENKSQNVITKQLIIN